MLKKVLGILALVLSFNSHAVYRMYIYESGANVILSGSGTLNLPGTQPPGSEAFSFGLPFGEIYTRGAFRTISGQGDFVGYNATSCPAPYTSGNNISYADARTGSGPRLDNDGARCFVSPPVNYVAGAPLAEVMTFNNRTLAGMLLIPGTYTWNFGAGQVTDSVILVVGSAPPVATVPTMSEWGMLILSALLAIGAFFVIRRGQRNRE
jgi:hypothetical protein